MVKQVENFEQLAELFVRHKHTGLDFSPVFTSPVVVSTALAGMAAATAGNYGIFFIAPFPVRVIQLQEVHTVAGSDAGAVTLTVEKLTGTTALDSGTVILSSALSLKATANTVQTGTLTSTRTALTLVRGDRLALKDAGNLTDVAGVCVTLYLETI